MKLTPYHPHISSVELVHANTKTPWDTKSLHELLTSNTGKNLPPFNPDYCLSVWELPKNKASPHSYVLRLSYADHDTLTNYTGELNRLQSVSKRHGLSKIIAPLALYAVEAEWPTAYTVVQYIDGGKTLQETAKIPKGQRLAKQLGATLTDYFQPGAPRYMADIAQQFQYSHNATLYDYDPQLLTDVTEWCDVTRERSLLSEWYTE